MRYVPLAAALLMFATTASAAEFEIPGNRKASEILTPAELVGPHYRIREKVVSYGYMHHWAVESDGLCLAPYADHSGKRAVS